MEENRFEAGAEEIKNRWSKSSEKIPHILWHYTDIRGGFGVIENRELWATSFQHLNDPHEFTYGIDIAVKTVLNFSWSVSTNHPEILSSFANHCKEEALNPKLPFYVCSLSEEQDSTHQWKNYANNGTGLSLGFLANELPINDLIRCFKVIYDPALQTAEAQKLCQEFDSLLSKVASTYGNSPHLKSILGNVLNDAWQSIYLLSARFKHKSWSNENEWRLIVFEKDTNLKYRTRGTGIVPYTTICLHPGVKSLKLLQLGPNLQGKDEIAANRLKTTNGLCCDILRSHATI